MTLAPAADGRGRRRAARRRGGHRGRAMRRTSAALELALAHDAWDADRRAVASRPPGSGSTTSTPTGAVGTLSGGQRTRLALATIMTTRPTCLLLDEPTNHLDDDAIEVLTGFLRDLPGVVLLASHDRVLLDDVVHRPRRPGRRRARHRRQRRAAASAAAGARTRRRGPRPVGGGRRRTPSSRRSSTGLRAATRIGTGAIAHDRGPTDGDKFIYSFKGGRRRPDPGPPQEGRAAPARRRRARAGAQATGAAAVPRRPDRRTASGRLVQARDVEVAGRLRRGPARPRGGGAPARSPAPTGRASPPCWASCPGGWPPPAARWTSRRARSRELTQDPQPADPARSALATYDAAVRDLADPPRLRELGLLHPRDHRTPVGSLSVGQRRRLAAGGRDRRRARPAAARRADQPRLARPRRRARGGARARPRRGRAGLPRPVAAAPLGGAASWALDRRGDVPGGVVLASHDRWLRRRWTGPELTLTPW